MCAMCVQIYVIENKLIKLQEMRERMNKKSLQTHLNFDYMVWIN